MSRFFPRVARPAGGWWLPTTIVALSVLTSLADRAGAADRFWVNPVGGGYGVAGNWSATAGGAGGAGAPGAADNAIFTLNGAYPVLFGADFSTSGVDVENGDVTWNLLGHTLTHDANVDIGKVAGQTGRLTVTQGALANNVDQPVDLLELITIGEVAGSTGILTVSTNGRVGDGTVRPRLIVGDGGVGTLAITDNGRVDAESLVLARAAGSTGTITVTGPNAVLDIGAETSLIGNQDEGAIVISGGGQLATAGTLRLGGSPGTGSGAVTVTGAGSRWTNSSTVHEIGYNGRGTLLISSGGQVESEIIYVGLNTDSEGHATVTGANSQWTVNNVLIVGHNGQGDLTVAAGADVSALSLYVGQDNRGVGVVTVTGVGSTLTTTGEVGVATEGTGTLNVSDGAVVTIGGDLRLGFVSGSNFGTLNLDGGVVDVADDFTNERLLNLQHSDGLLRVAGDFTLDAVSNVLTIEGDDSSDLPILDLFGDGFMYNVLSIRVGSSQRGQLLLRQGRFVQVSSHGVSVGSFAGGEGTLSILSGSHLGTTGILSVGGVSATPGLGTINIFDGSVDVAELRVRTGSTVNLGTSTVRAGVITNDGSITVSSGNADLHGNLSNNVGATVVTSGGGAVTTFFDDVVNQGQIRTNAGARTVILGAVSGAGSFPGTGVVEQLGDTRPGNSPAIVSYGGDLIFADTSQLFIEIGGATAGSQHDRITVAGSVVLDGTLDVTRINGFSPTLPGQIFTIITAGSRTGTFDDIQGVPSATLPGLGWIVIYTPQLAILTTIALPGDIDLDGDVDRRDTVLFTTNLGRTSGSIWTTGDFNFDGMTTLADLEILQSNLGMTFPSPSASPTVAVPEPGTWSLVLLTGGLALARGRRRLPFFANC